MKNIILVMALLMSLQACESTIDVAEMRKAVNQDYAIAVQRLDEVNSIYQLILGERRDCTSEKCISRANNKLSELNRDRDRVYQTIEDLNNMLEELEGMEAYSE